MLAIGEEDGDEMKSRERKRERERETERERERERERLTDRGRFVKRFPWARMRARVRYAFRQLLSLMRVREPSTRLRRGAGDVLCPEDESTCDGIGSSARQWIDLVHLCLSRPECLRQLLDALKSPARRTRVASRRARYVAGI